VTCWPSPQVEAHIRKLGQRNLNGLTHVGHGVRLIEVCVTLPGGSRSGRRSLSGFRRSEPLARKRASVVNAVPCSGTDGSIGFLHGRVSTNRCSIVPDGANETPFTGTHSSPLKQGLRRHQRPSTARRIPGADNTIRARLDRPAIASVVRTWAALWQKSPGGREPVVRIS
jgi:hypothetical protein